MEELEFNLDEFETDVDKANALMVYLVNRAAAFNSAKFDGIYVDFVDLPCGHVAWHLCCMVAMYKNLPIYTSDWSKSARFYRKDKNIKVIKSQRKFKKITSNPRILMLDAITTCSDDFNSYCDKPYPQIFYGFSDETLKFIATNLYGWCDDKKEYKKMHKKVKPKKMKKVKNDAE